MNLKSIGKNIWNSTTLQVLLFIVTCSLILLHRRDTTYQYNLLLFSGWLLTFSLSLFLFLLKKYHILKEKKTLVSLDKWILLAMVIFFAATTRLLFLGKYPFVTVFDELRDAGLNGLYIKKHIIQDVFGFGSYQGYGNIIPYFSYIFQSIFPASRYAYILPSAIIGIISIVCTYILGRKLAGRMGGFAAAIFLTASIFHLHYSRTELVIIFDALMAPILILATYWTVRDRYAYLLLGLLIGFSMHLYAGLRGIMVSCAIFLMVRASVHLIRPFLFDHLNDFLNQAKYYLIVTILFFMGFVIGLGPTINVLKKNTVMSNTGATQFIFKNPDFLKRSPLSKAQYLYTIYERSFLTYITTPIGSHFPYKESALLSFPINWLFLAGLGYLIINQRHKNALHYIMTVTVLIFPFTNQVLINDYTADHRMMSIVPLLSITAAYGLIKLTESKLPRLAPYIITAFTALFFVTQVTFYFYARPTDMNYDGQGTKEYVLQSMLEYGSNMPNEGEYYLVNNQPYNYDLAHYKEKMEYLMYPKKMKIIEKNSLPDLIKNNLHEHKKTALFYINSIPQLDALNGEVITIHCGNNTWLPNYFCPKNWLTDYSFNIARVHGFGQNVTK